MKPNREYYLSKIDTLMHVIDAINYNLETKKFLVSFHQLRSWRKRKAILTNMIKKYKKDIIMLNQLPIFIEL